MNDFRFRDKQQTPGGTLIDTLYEKIYVGPFSLTQEDYLHGLFPANYYMVKAAQDVPGRKGDNSSFIYRTRRFDYYLLAMKNNSYPDAKTNFEDLPFTEEKEKEFKKYFRPMHPQPPIRGGNKKRTRRRKSSRRRYEK